MTEQELIDLVRIHSIDELREMFNHASDNSHAVLNYILMTDKVMVFFEELCNQSLLKDENDHLRVTQGGRVVYDPTLGS